MRNNLKYIFIFFAITFLSLESIGQLSIFNKIKYVDGLNTKVIPSGNSFLAFSDFREIGDTTRKFRVTKFDECRDIDWARDYSTEEIVGISLPDAVIGRNEDVFLLLKSTETALDKLTLVKMNKNNGDIEWSRSYGIDGLNILSSNSNILLNQDVIYLISNDELNNTVIISIDLDGEVLHSKKIEGISHGSSVIDGRGDLLIFSKDSSYAKIKLAGEIIDTLVWAKYLKGRVFDILNDPLSINTSEDTAVITGIIDNKFKKDTAIYRLVKFNIDGDIIKETAGFFAPDYKFSSYNSLKMRVNDISDSKLIYYMLNSEVLFFNSDLGKSINPKIYKFNEEDYFVSSTSLEICDDVSLVMSGFCYKNNPDGTLDTNTPYMFVSKTQPANKNFIIESETPNCLEDSTVAQNVQLTNTQIDDIATVLDTIIIISKDVDFTSDYIIGLNQDKCGKINLDENEESFDICPGEKKNLIAPSYKCASLDYKWSSGETISHIQKSSRGIYTCTVTFCDTAKVSTFEIKYKQNVDECFEVFYPNAFFPDDKTETYNPYFKTVRRTYEDSEGNEIPAFEFSAFELKIFDRWGEKVFETNDPALGWDGTYRGKAMTPGAYIYDVHWEYDVLKEDGSLEKKYQDTKTGQVMLLR